MFKQNICQVRVIKLVCLTSQSFMHTVLGVLSEPLQIFDTHIKKVKKSSGSTFI